MVRVAIVIIVPFTLIWAFVATLTSGIGKAFEYAWLDVLSEADSIRSAWAANSINPEDWK